MWGLISQPLSYAMVLRSLAALEGSPCAVCPLPIVLLYRTVSSFSVILPFPPSSHPITFQGSLVWLLLDDTPPLGRWQGFSGLLRLTPRKPHLVTTRAKSSFILGCLNRPSPSGPWLSQLPWSC